MANHWAGVTIDCADPIRMSTFWAALLGIPASNEHGSDPNWATVGSRSGPLPRLTFQRVPEPKADKVRIHLDLEVDDIDDGRQQVENLGGRFSGSRHDYDEGVVLNMLDPEGHEFCLVQYFDTSETQP
ncbi:putative enzyme related to lactoylglutathione lyase [Mycobacterium sp. BK086]|uniref:VOC family protein n=1 Tax=Mycobacterium sp. BK086 TaxID=2512165 RepID=UPI0010604683|nr:VOC family protein [Mycobacterium sp. BK086]TDO08990.1 putative enzyme related to lactoylglutathione lyase [Mycobacterium sp. BK086]